VFHHAVVEALTQRAGAQHLDARREEQAGVEPAHHLSLRQLAEGDAVPHWQCRMADLDSTRPDPPWFGRAKEGEMAGPAPDPQDGGQKKTTPESIWSKPPWLRALLIWGAIGIFLLFFGGVAAQGYMRLMPCPAGTVCPAPHISKATLWGLAYLSVGGGVALGLIGVALTLANPRGPGWGFGIVVIGTLLFLVFVWPTA